MRLLTYAFFISCFSTLASYSQKTEMTDVFGRISCDDYLARMQVAINSARKNPDSKVYFVMYEGPSEIWVGKSFKKKMANPVYGSFQAKVRSMKRYILMNKFDLRSFRFIDGGFRDEPMVEVWLVPGGSNPPKPNPTKEKMRYRKGKAKGFCVDCC